MRKVIAILIFVFVSGVCSAPNIDFRLGLMKIREASEKEKSDYYDSEFSRFITDLGHNESGNNWLSVNQIGCFGEWQFRESTLWHLGYRKITLQKFINNPDIFPPDLQLTALKTLIKLNLLDLADYKHFIGDSINGVKITKSGMIAASHLGGAGSLQKYLDSRGKVNNADLFGTSIADYMKKFNDYDLN
jgi:hypothetical protein